MKRILGISLAVLLHWPTAWAQDTVTAPAATVDSAAIAAATLAATPAPNNPDLLSTPIQGTPFSLLGLLVVGLSLLWLLVYILCLLLERSLLSDLARLRSGPGEDTYQARAQRILAYIRGTRIAFTWGMGIFIGLFGAIQFVKGTPMEGHINEWLNLLVRWAHVTFGVAWIGTSFYFIFLENALHRGPGVREGLAGNLWAIHGGGFYYLEKFKVAPPKLPEKLHWFKWEAYITWISGVSLLAVVYYLNASSLLVDKNVADISSAAAIAIGAGTLVASWFVYDLLCKSPLVENKPLFFFLMLGYITLIAFFLTHYLSPRGAYIHVGAVIGTMMAGNVWRVIIPAQKAMVQAAKEGKPVNPELGRHAGLRSLHNNYFTLPVLFIMISNHFPSTYGHTFNWAVLGALTLISAGVKHYFNLKDKGERSPFLIPVAAAGMLGVFFITAPKATDPAGKSLAPVDASFYRAYQVIQRRCATCHSAHPIDDVNIIAPNGIVFDTPEQIKLQADRILVRAVTTRTMPQNNKTNITEEEREILHQWIEQGAKIDE